MGFAKLDECIVDSSIWAEPPETRVVWITLLAKSDANGFVACSLSGLQRASNVSMEATKQAVAILESPDPDSRTPEHEGRRIEKVEGGWLILNYRAYRAKEHSEQRRRYMAELMRRRRGNEQREAANELLTPANNKLTGANLYASASASVEDLEGRVGKDAEDLPMPDAKASSEALQALMTAFRIKPLDASLQAIRGNVVELLARGATPDEIADLAAWATDDEVALKAGVPLTAVSLTDPARFAGFQSTMRRHLAEIEAERKKRNR